MTDDEYHKIAEVTARLTRDFVPGARVRILSWPHTGQEGRIFRCGEVDAVLVEFVHVYGHLEHVWMYQVELELL